MSVAVVVRKETGKKRLGRFLMDGTAQIFKENGDLAFEIECNVTYNEFVRTRGELMQRQRSYYFDDIPSDIDLQALSYQRADLLFISTEGEHQWFRTFCVNKKADGSYLLMTRRTELIRGEAF